MTDPKHDDKEKAAVALLPGAAGAISTGLVAAATPGVPASVAAATALVSLFPIAVMLATNRYFTDQKRRVDRWWKAVCERLGEDPEAVRNEAEARADDPETAKVIAQSARELLNALDDAVVPALAALTAEYIKERKPADSFFRGFSRVLSEISANQLDILKTFVVNATALLPKEESIFTVACRPTDEGPAGTFALITDTPDIYTIRYFDDDMAPSIQLFRAMTVNGMGHDAGRGPLYLMLERRIIDRVGAIVGSVSDP